MNTTIDQTHIHDETDGRRRALSLFAKLTRRGATARSRCRRLAVIAAVAVPAAVGTIAVLPASPAAAWGDPTYDHWYFQVQSNVKCDHLYGYITQDVTIKPKPGYEGMWVQVRQRATDIMSGATVTVATTSAQQVWNSGYFGIGTLVFQQASLQKGIYARFTTDVRYWSGTGWSPWYTGAVRHMSGWGTRQSYCLT